jgi:hypothetical protein
MIRDGKKIRLIESNVKCCYKKIDLYRVGLCGRCFICMRPPPLLKYQHD